MEMIAGIEVISDILLVGGALGAGFYCFVLARRLARFNDLETGIGGAVAVLSAQVDDLNRTLLTAQKAAANSTGTLEGLTERAEGVAKRLELLVASMHDLPTVPQAGASVPTPQVREPSQIKSEPIFMRHRAAEGREIR